MDTQPLRSAYDEFLTVARTGHFAHPASGWGPEMVLAHVVVSDRLIAQAVGRVMAGQPAAFDNLASQSEPLLQATVEAAGSWDGLIAAVERGADELIALAGRLTDKQGTTPIGARIVGDGAVIFDATVPIAKLIHVPADLHLRAHMQQLVGQAPAATEVRKVPATA